jgi:hypothetical protein
MKMKILNFTVHSHPQLGFFQHCTVSVQHRNPPRFHQDVYPRTCLPPVTGWHHTTPRGQDNCSTPSTFPSGTHVQNRITHTQRVCRITECINACKQTEPTQHLSPHPNNYERTQNLTSTQWCYWPSELDMWGPGGQADGHVVVGRGRWNRLVQIIRKD